MSFLTQGVHDGISEDRYHADPCPKPSLSRSCIHELITKTPRHVKHAHPRMSPKVAEEDNPKFDLGKAGHALLLEGVDKAEVIDAADWRTKKAQEARDEARANGKIPFLPHQWADAQAMVLAAERQITECAELGINDLRRDGNAEQTVIWQEESGIWCRVRPDWWSNDRQVILDAKFVDNANPEEFHRKVTAHAYDIQDQFYSRGAFITTGIMPKFVFAVIENTFPFMASFICLDPTFKELGNRKMWAGIEIWEKCMESGKWPGYPQRVCHICAPVYELAKWEVTP